MNILGWWLVFTGIFIGTINQIRDYFVKQIKPEYVIDINKLRDKLHRHPKGSFKMKKSKGFKGNSRSAYLLEDDEDEEYYQDEQTPPADETEKKQ